MTKYYIRANALSPLADIVEPFAYQTANNYGTAELSLSPMGHYSLYIREHDVTEAMVKRTDSYRQTLSFVSSALVAAYDKQLSSFTQMHDNMPSVRTKNSYRNLLNTLSPQKYARRNFSLPKPTKKQMEDDLRVEATSLLYHKNDTPFTVVDYVRSHLPSMLELRQCKWQEAMTLFDNIESAREAEANAKYYAAYQMRKQEMQEIFDGVPSRIKSGILALDSQLNIPLELSLTYTYHQPTGVLDMDVIFERAIAIPDLRCKLLSTGKVSVTKKPMSDIVTERSQCMLSLTFLLASHLFAISPNINVVHLSLFNHVKSEAYLWVEFHRCDFESSSIHSIYPLYDISNFKTVLNMRVRGDNVEIMPYDTHLFAELVAEA